MIITVIFIPGFTVFFKIIFKISAASEMMDVKGLGVDEKEIH